MSSAAGSEPFQCPTHGPKHAFFLSHRRSSDEQIARDLKRLLASVGQRRHGEPISVFLDSDCLDGTAGVSTDALPGSAVAVLLVSKSSMNGMKELADQGEPDSVVDEIRTALDLKDAKPDLPVLPLCIATLEDGGYIDFKPYMMSFPSDPKFASLKHTIDRMNQIQMYGFRPDQPHKRLYRLLTLFSPIFSNPGLRDAIPTKYYVDNLFLGDMGHLDSLLRQVTLTGRAVVSGMGGMGKSVLARQFLQFMMGTLAVSNDGELDGFKLETVGIKPQYSRIYWVNCATESTALDSLVDIFPHIKPGEIKQHASRILSQSREYLLVLDNVDDMAVVDSVFEHSVAAGFSGDVVVTTRLSALDEGPFLTALGAKLDDFQQAPLRLESWKNETAFDYILATSPMIAVKVGTDQDRATLRKLMDRINGYPLVIQTVRIYAECNDTPIDEIEAQFAQALEEQDGEDETRSSLKVIVDLSMSTLLKKGAVGVEACRLFGAISLLAPDDIPLELITAIAQKMELSADAAHLVKMVCESGLLRPGPDEQYYTHSLTQRVAHEWVVEHGELNSDRIEDATGEALLDRIKIPCNRKDLELGRHLDLYARNTVPDILTKRLHFEVLTRMGRVTESRGAYREAESIFTLLLPKIIAFHGTRHHSDVAANMSNMAVLYSALGRHEDALKYFEEAIDLLSNLFGTRRNLAVARIIGNAGDSLRNLGRLPEAAAHMQESLDIMIESIGTREHPLVATTLNGLAGILQDQGRFKESFELYQEAYDLMIRFPETSSDITIGTVLSNMGSAALKVTRYQVALEYLQQALDIRLRVFGTREHLDIATTLGELGIVALHLGQYESAANYLKESLDITVRSVGTREHSDVATALTNLGTLASCQGLTAQSLALHMEALTIFRKVFQNKPHPLIITALCNIGDVSKSQDDPVGALSRYFEAMEMAASVYSTRDHPKIASILVRMASIVGDMNMFDQARGFYLQALDIYVKVYGTREHEDVALLLNNLGCDARVEGKLDQAMEYLREALDLRIKIFGTKLNPDVAESINNIAAVEWNRGHSDEAIAHLGEARDILITVHGSKQHPKVARTIMNMAEIYRSQSRYRESTAAFQEVIEIQMQIDENRNHRNVVRSLDSIAEMAEDLDDVDEALEALQEVLVIRKSNGDEAATMKLLHTMAKLAGEHSRFVQAQTYNSDLLELAVRLLGTREHQLVAETLNNIGLALSAQSSFEEAVKYHLEALDVALRLHKSREHVDVASIFVNLGNAEHGCGRLEEAQQRYQEALDIFSKLIATVKEWTVLPGTQM
ncbi:uncharacterized protein BJ171DRAFT_590976 [Polychytrium aggregatum]|uniref:uncharacterized protein n=1 Tax=Polychytrium aggregatum TaxID=110093 RepID=UPI0022FF01B4|nr:uncharacterized protein BJ171DRAFT_590976 [Polychytrium aggregatum]KAI9190743.1 hypothetical protein BJ171DRAFT_590976 [Polychytrium aggregatum]